jgi:hypothetical protein
MFAKLPKQQLTKDPYFWINGSLSHPSLIASEDGHHHLQLPLGEVLHGIVLLHDKSYLQPTTTVSAEQVKVLICRTDSTSAWHLQSKSQVVVTVT